MAINVHIAESFSEDLLDIIRCKHWFFNLTLYLLRVNLDNNGNSKDMVKAIKSFSFFNKKTEEADYCRSLIEFSARKLRDGPSAYSCAPEYVDYINSGGKAKMTYEDALNRLEFEKEHRFGPSTDIYNTKLKFIQELKHFRSVLYEYLINKEKPEDELLSPKQVLQLIAKFFAYEVVFCTPRNFI